MVKPIFNDTGAVKYISLEEAFYGIIADHRYGHFKKPDPINLQSDFIDDCLRVKFKARIISRGGFHIWGIYVEILEIEELK